MIKSKEKHLSKEDKLLQKNWKSEFDRLFLLSLSNNRLILGTIRKII